MASSWEPRPPRRVFADPPYNVQIDGHVSGFGQVHHREFAMASGEMTPEAFSEFLTAALRYRIQRSTAKILADSTASSAVVAAIAPICVDRFQRSADAADNLTALKKTDAWQQAAMSKKAVGR